MIYLRTVGVTSVLAHCTVIHSENIDHRTGNAFIIAYNYKYMHLPKLKCFDETKSVKINNL